MSPVVIRYPLDPTGKSPDNLVAGEVHTPPRRKIRAIAPVYGAFFTESVKIFDVAAQSYLTPNVQFEAVELYELPTARYGKEICAILLITDESVGDSLSIEYQALGGEFSASATAILQLLDKVNLDNRPAAYGDLIDRPSEYPPSHHLHDIGDVFGFEYFTHGLDRIRRAIELGDDLSHDRIFRYIDQTLAGFSPFTQEVMDALASKVSVSAKATNAQVDEGLSDNTWMSPLKTLRAISTWTHLLMQYATEEQAGKVEFATADETSAGASNTLAVHPAGLKAAVGTLVPDATTTVKGKMRLATSAETLAGTISNCATHPAGVKAAIDQAVANLIASAPGALDTLNELATALGNDANFATTITTALSGKQSKDATLTALAGLVTAQDQMIYSTGVDTFSMTALTAFGRSVLAAADDVAARTLLNVPGASHTHFQLVNGSATATLDASGNFVASGNVGAFSDPGLKRDFTRFEDPLAMVDKLNGGYFFWREGIESTAAVAGKRDVGVLADQVEAVLPELVFEQDGYRAVAYQKLCALLLEAVKALNSEVRELRSAVFPYSSN